MNIKQKIEYQVHRKLSLKVWHRWSEQFRPSSDATDHSILSGSKQFHYENTPIKIYRNFHLQKLKIFR